MKKPARKSAIDGKCKDCIYDHACPGTWRQQVTLYEDKSCHLWLFRPQATTAIPESVLRYYRAKSGQAVDPDASAE